MSKDRYGITLGADICKQIGLKMGDPVNLEIDIENNKIILTKHEEELENTGLESDRLPNTNKVKKSLPLSVKKCGPRKKTEKKEYCKWCKKELKSDEQLKISGQRVCHECKYIEIERFKNYLKAKRKETK